MRAERAAAPARHKATGAFHRMWPDPSKTHGQATGPVIFRIRLVETSVGMVEHVRTAGATFEKGADDFSPEFQVALPY
jgi:hypothetical protein